MALRPPPRFVVRPHNPGNQRRLVLWLVAGWLASVAIACVVTASLDHHGVVLPSVTSNKQQLQALAAQNDDLKQQIVNLQRAAQVTDVATRSLRQSLAEREEEISGLRADLGFYSRLTGGSAQREGMRVQEVTAQAVPNSHAWNLTLSLTQNADRGADIDGNATLSVEGLRGDKVVRLDWPALGDNAQAAGMPFRFKYFQQLHATIVLPADFRPTRLLIRAQPAGGSAVDRVVTWNDALAGNATPTQGEQDAQP